MARSAGAPFSDDAFEHINAAIISSETLEIALDLILQRTCDLLEVPQSMLFLIDESGQQLRLAAISSGLPAQPVLVKRGVGVEGWVLQRGRPLAIINPAADPRFAPFQPWNEELPTTAALAVASVPVRSAASIVGVLSVIDTIQANPDLSSKNPLGTASIAELLPFLAVLADLVGLALENRDILRRQERRTQLIRLLHTIAAIPASEATEELAQTITNQLCTIMHADVATIFLHSAATDELIAFGSSDTPLGRLQREYGLDHIPLATGGSLFSVFQRETPLLLNQQDALADLPLMAIATIQSVLIVPLRIDNSCQGVILLAASYPNTFTDDDLSFLTFISVRLGYALHHDKLTDELAAAEQARIQQDTRDSFISIVAHDLKNALTAISGTSHLALRKAARGDIEYSQKALSVVVAKAAQALQLVNDMVDVNNVDDGQFRLFIAPVDLIALLQEEIESAQGLSNQHAIVLQLPVDSIEVAADRQRLRQVLDNLIANAIHYSPAGGTITVALTTLVEQAPDSGDTQQLPQGVQITVADQGMGIAAEDLPYIFDRFYRGRGSYIASGSGLGLYIAAEIITQHGGKLWVESTYGQGAHFHITLPLRRYSEADRSPVE